MKQKKTLCALLSAILITAMAAAACGTKSDDISGTITASKNIEASADGTGTREEADSASVKEAASEGITAESAAETSLGEKPLSLSRIQGGIYTNEYLGITCELDSSWQFYTAEELQELPANIEDMLKDTAVGEYISDLEHIMDVSAENLEDLTSFNILYQKLSMQERIAYSTMSEEEIIELVLSQSSVLESTYAQMGMIIKEMSSKKITFLGQERTGLWMLCDVDGNNYYSLQLHNYDIGEYASTITFSSFHKDATQEIMDLFTPTS